MIASESASANRNDQGSVPLFRFTFELLLSLTHPRVALPFDVTDLAGGDKRVKRSAAADFARGPFLGDAVLTGLEQDPEMALLIGCELGTGTALCSDKCCAREWTRTLDAWTNRTRMNRRNPNDAVNSCFTCRHWCCLSEAKTGKGQESD